MSAFALPGVWEPPCAPTTLWFFSQTPMYTAGEVVFYRRSDGTLVPATMLGPGAQSETVQIEYNRKEHMVKHPAAAVAKFSHPIPVMPNSPELGSSSSQSPIQ